MMVVAIAVGVFAVASISTAYTILKREILRNYLSTNPAAALLDGSREWFMTQVLLLPGKSRPSMVM